MRDWHMRKTIDYYLGTYLQEKASALERMITFCFLFGTPHICWQPADLRSKKAGMSENVRFPIHRITVSDQ